MGPTKNQSDHDSGKDNEQRRARGREGLKHIRESTKEYTSCSNEVNRYRVLTPPPKSSDVTENSVRESCSRSPQNAASGCEM